MKDTINRSGEVIQNLIISQGERSYAYAYAFGFAWALLTEKQRIQMLKLAEQKANEKEEN
jgi:hypothetical protein